MNRKHFAIAGLVVLSCLTFALGWVTKPVLNATANVGQGSAGSVNILAEPSRLRSGDAEKILMMNGAGDERIDPAVHDAPMVAYQPLTQLDLEELKEQFKRELDPIKRRKLFAKILSPLTVENAKELRELIAHLGDRSPEFQEFHYAWGKITGAAAVLDGMNTSARDMESTLAGWASVDPSVATDWWSNLAPEGKTPNNQAYLKRGLIHGLANNDPNAATDFVYGLAEAGDKGASSLLKIVAEKMVQNTGVDGAVRWSENLPEGPLRASAMDRVAHDYVRQNPEDAASWVSNHASDNQNAWVVEEVSYHWAARDAPKAISWLETLESSKGKNEGLSSAYAQWGARDPEAASKYIVDLPDSPDRNFAINGFISGLAPSDPQAAVVWAAEITSPGMKEAAMIRAGQQYYGQNSAEATQWFAESGLPRSAWEQVTAPPNRRGRPGLYK